MEAIQKNFSVVIKVEEFLGQNGELTKLSDEKRRNDYIHSFFMQNYGQGSGNLKILQKKNKVKLVWLPQKVDSQAENLHKTALAHAKNKNYVEAINTWIKAISLNSSDPDYYFNLGIAFFEIKNYKESIENLNKTLLLCPIYYKAHIILGTVCLKVRKFTDSEKHLKESIKFFPNHALTFLNLGAVYSILKQYDDAIAMFSRTLELSPYEVRAYFGLGKIYAFKNDIDKANFHFNKVIEFDKQGHFANHAKRAIVTVDLESDVQVSQSLDDGNFENLYRDGYRAFLFADYKRAIKFYTGYLRHKPNDDFVWFSLGEACLRCGETTKALEAFTKAIGLNAKKALYYKELSIVYSCFNRDLDVIKCLTKAKEFGKNDSISNTLWGKALINQKKYSDSIPILEEAVRLDSNNISAKFYLGVAYKHTNQLNYAHNSLQEVMLSPVKSPLKKEAESLIAEIAHQ